MAETRLDEPRSAGVLSAVSNALVSLHKEQFGRGPVRARTHFAGSDVLVLHDGGRAASGRARDGQDGRPAAGARVQSRLQAATRNQFIGAVEAIIRRRVKAFASAIDADEGVVWEVFSFEPVGAQGDGARP